MRRRGRAPRVRPRRRSTAARACRRALDGAADRRRRRGAGAAPGGGAGGVTFCSLYCPGCVGVAAAPGGASAALASRSARPPAPLGRHRPTVAAADEVARGKSDQQAEHDAPAQPAGAGRPRRFRRVSMSGIPGPSARRRTSGSSAAYTDRTSTRSSIGSRGAASSSARSSSSCFVVEELLLSPTSLDEVFGKALGLDDRARHRASIVVLIDQRRTALGSSRHRTRRRLVERRRLVDRHRSPPSDSVAPGRRRVATGAATGGLRDPNGAPRRRAGRDECVALTGGDTARRTTGAGTAGVRHGDRGDRDRGDRRDVRRPRFASPRAADSSAPANASALA